jgi:hypothetical protein
MSDNIWQATAQDREDGTYLFDKRADAEAFAEAVTRTDDPFAAGVEDTTVNRGEEAGALIAAERGDRIEEAGMPSVAEDVREGIDLSRVLVRLAAIGEHHSEAAALLRAVATFANGEGGEILIGVGDDGAVIGWNPEKARDRITDIVSAIVKETPSFEVFVVRIEDTPIVVVRVTPSPPHLRPHQVRDRAMIRVNATTRAASPTELRQLIAPEMSGFETSFPTVSPLG